MFKLLNLLGVYSIRAMLVIIVLLMIKVIWGTRSKFWINYSKAIRTMSIPFMMVIIINFMVNILGGYNS